MKKEIKKSFNGSLQLYEMYFMQYANLLFNCETQYLKLTNLELSQIIEKFWRYKVYCQFVIFVLERVGMNIIPKYLWKVIINRKREAQLLQALTGFSHQHLFCGTFSQIILTKFISNLTDAVSLIQILERTKYNANCF